VKVFESKKIVPSTLWEEIRRI